MSDNLKTQKDSLRAEAIRARSLLSLDAGGYDDLCANFFDNIDISGDKVLAFYWSKDRELDLHILIDQCIDNGVSVALPIIEDNSRILKFVNYDRNCNMVAGKYGIAQPVINDDTIWLEPDVFLVPLLAFDRRGNRLGYGGGYYDATLLHYSGNKDILAVGVAYAKQACLFNLPTEKHDVKLDWIITEQSAIFFK